MLSTTLRNVLTQLVDPYCGLITAVNEEPTRLGSPRLFHYVAISGSTVPINGIENFQIGSAASVSRERAIWKSIGECVERYSSSFFSKNSLIFGSWETLHVNAIHPSRFALYAKEQFDDEMFPWSPFDEKTAINWTAMHNHITNSTTFAPAAMVYMPYTYAIEEQPIVQPISTGLASHLGTENALKSAICECIERDAFTIHWQRKISPPKIQIEEDKGLPGKIYRKITAQGAKVDLFDITLDHRVPTVLAIMRSEGNRPPITVSASASPHPADAAISALEELAHTHRYMCQVRSNASDDLEKGLNPSQVETQEDHMKYWSFSDRGQAIDFIFRNTNSYPLDEMVPSETSTQALIDIIFETTGCEVCSRELTTDDVGSLGFSVVRALIPGFHPLFLGHSIRARGGSRLWEIPEKLGLQFNTDERTDNLDPHPFP